MSSVYMYVHAYVCLNVLYIYIYESLYAYIRLCVCGLLYISMYTSIYV
jgi:hypothetical protein